ncbi:hypothetical protein Lalb_Chr11g0069791 [Lupinus albus]|uniref:Uncharacterized protein n=1 Tax=Lupinus albus TaxID=3870 RepID=A0A6A4PS03_LUPAL|nr:hypothetical protein Lalb_Chr11g0069791 [Lupinus albus]
MKTVPYRPVRPENRRTRPLTGTAQLLYRTCKRTGQNRSVCIFFILNFIPKK